MAIGLVIGGVSLYSISNATVHNDADPRVLRNKGAISAKNILKPDPEAETFEMGLFMASQNELMDKEEQIKEEESKHLVRGYLYKAKYYFVTYIWDNLFTCGRFVELTFIMFPILILWPISWFGKRDPNNNNERYGGILWYRALRFSIELAGASFIKLGQWAASRTDIFPKQMCKELSNLHSDAKPHSLYKTKKIICRTFGIDNFDDIFEEFIEKPLGVGAIAQVYVGKLHKNLLRDYELDDKNIIKNEPAANQWVAVKVLHPNVEIKIERDLKIMKFFASVIDYIPTMEWLSLPAEVEQFSMLMKIQLDLRIEGVNLAKFEENFKGRNDVKFPKPYMKFSGREVLIEEYIQGISISKILELKDNFGTGLLKEVSDKILDSFLQMLILDDFIHADLHPGNILVRFYKTDQKYLHNTNDRTLSKVSTEEEMNQIVSKLRSFKDDPKAMGEELTKMFHEGYHAEVCFIDTGLVTELNHVDRVNFIELFNALSEFDGYRAGELMFERSRTPETAIDKEIFALKVERLVDRIKQRTFTLGGVSIGDLLDQVLGIVRQHHVRMEGDFITVIVAILLLEGIGRQLDPNLDLFASALPVLRQLGLQDGKLLLRNGNTISMVKVWLALEIRQFFHASIHDIHNLVKSDGLCPNY
ncbi:hypothetical protein PACTADRAFT_73514 [Pachysolen tannophilus NRRL Y-2460]|uniref:Protein kinase domain-containing protein n=1 Tax=Pachysolen tannophilus NRRL Y-2460 TaxID=669874 RepID=A0A1E4U1F3_PACTA|nr:hypothetical protein PACTADRAFT_73514 [Pachysolen tannophilus NRRL Y-2460]